MNNNNLNNNNNNNLNNSLNSIDSNNLLGRIRIYLFIVFISYFIIKILYAPFGIYPDKYNYGKYLLKSCKNINVENYIKNYTPDIWNTELFDFLILMVLCIILFLFKFNNTFPKDFKNSFTNISLWLPFIITLFIPPLLTIIYSNNKLNKNYNGVEIEYITSDENIIKMLNKNNIFIYIESFIIIFIGIAIIIISIITNQDYRIKYHFSLLF